MPDKIVQRDNNESSIISISYALVIKQAAQQVAQQICRK